MLELCSKEATALGPPFLPLLTLISFISPPDHPTHGPERWLEFGVGQADRLDEGGPGDGVPELQEGNVPGYEVVEILVNHDASEQKLSAIFWEVLDSHSHGVLSGVLGSAGP